MENAEKARQRYLQMFSIDYETDFKSDKVLAFCTLAMTPQHFLILPSFGIGGGIPVDLTTKESGFRIAYEMSWFILGLAFKHDYYPTCDRWNSGAFVQLTL